MILLLITTLAQATGFETINGLRYLIDSEKNEASLIPNDTLYSGILLSDKTKNKL